MQKRLGGACSDIGGFTRLFNSPDAKPDGMMNEIPTLLVSQLHHGSCAECDHGFIVMNRPWGAVQLVETDYFRTQIAEDYLFLIETDHMMLRPPVNAATEERPVGFGFYYMVANDPKLAPVVRRFLAPGIGLETVDAVGPSPLLVHKTMLAKLARPWWELSVQMKLDDEANRVFGWVLEMWGYNLAARNLGIRHTVSQSIQVEPQGVGTDDMADKDIYHYTFGHVLPGWKLDKRMYSGRYPPDHMPPPPLCSAKSAAVIRDLWTEAAQAIPGWETKVPGENYSALLTRQAPLARLTAMPRERSGGLAAMLVGTGPWNWGRLKGLYLFSRGVTFVQPPASAAGVASESAVNKAAHGTWSEGPGGTVALRVCGTTYVLAFADPAAPWTFSATKASDSGASEARAPGSLSRLDQRGAIMHPLDPALRPGAFGDCGGSGCGGGAGNATLVEEMAGSGPWEWAGVAPFGFMRGGELITPWGTGTWGSTRGAGSEVAPADTVFADFANSQHSIRVLDRTCLRLGSVRKVRRLRRCRHATAAGPPLHFCAMLREPSLSPSSPPHSCPCIIFCLLPSSILMPHAPPPLFLRADGRREGVFNLSGAGRAVRRR